MVLLSSRNDYSRNLIQAVFEELWLVCDTLLLKELEKVDFKSLWLPLLAKQNEERSSNQCVEEVAPDLDELSANNCGETEERNVMNSIAAFMQNQESDKKTGRLTLLLKFEDGQSISLRQH